MNKFSYLKRAYLPRLLARIGIIFLVGWFLSAAVLFFLSADWPAYVGAGILFFGLWISFAVALYVVKRKFYKTKKEDPKNPSVRYDLRLVREDDGQLVWKD